MAKFEKKIQAHKLRAQGKSIKDISKELGVSKGSVSLWCRNILLTELQKENLLLKQIKSGHLGRIRGAARNKEKRIESIQKQYSVARKQIGKFSKRDLMMVGIGLYWGEGTKAKKAQLTLSNSDPDMVLFIIKWFKEVFNIKNEEFMPRIFINKIHEDRLKKVLSFWSKKLSLPKSQFGKPILLNVKNKKIYKNHDKYYGVLALRIHRSTLLKYNVLGLIESLKHNSLPG